MSINAKGNLTRANDELLAVGLKLEGIAAPGAIRPQSVPDHSTISNVLTAVDSVAVILDHALRYPTVITPAWASTLVDQLRTLADVLDGGAQS